MTNELKVLIAGVGNELRQDDAFGVLLAQKLQQEASFPPSVTVIKSFTSNSASHGSFTFSSPLLWD